MIVYAVVSPSVFQAVYFEIPGYRDQVVLFFRSLQSNAVLLIDPEGSLLEDIEAAIKQLSIKFRQDLEIRVAELRKSLREKRRCRAVVKLCRSHCNAARSQPPVQRCLSVALASIPDAVFVPDGGDEYLSVRNAGLVAVRMSEYSRSDFEVLRRRYMEDLPPVDQLAPHDFDELIIRATKYSTWLRVFDKQIGKGKNVSNFRRGVERILKVWATHAHFFPQRLEIVTAEATVRTGTEDEFQQTRKEQLVREAIQRVAHLLVEPLRRDYRQEVYVSVKQDHDGIFHARHLQTQTAVLLVERGFDIEKDDGGLRRNFLKWDLGGQEHVEECRRLPDIEVL